MDEGRKRDAESIEQGGPAISPEPPVSPYGKSVWLGTALGVLSFISAVWTVADRFLSRFMQDIGGAPVLAGYQILRALLTNGAGALVLALLCLLAARRSESLPDRAAFAGLALAEIIQSVGLLSGLWLPDGNASFYLAAVCVPLAGMARVAAFLVLFTNRENGRDARSASLITGCVWIVRTVAAVVTYFVTWVITGGSYDEVWVLLLNVTSNITLFGAIFSGVMGGLAFLFLRNTVPTTTYPEKTEEQ